MNKIDRLTYLITREIKDRPAMEKFTRDEYRKLLRQIAAWIQKETRQ